MPIAANGAVPIPAGSYDYYVLRDSLDISTAVRDEDRDDATAAAIDNARTYVGSAPINDQAAAYFASHVVQEPANVKAAVNAFIRRMRMNGFWTIIDRLHLPMSTEQASLQDMKQPGVAGRALINQGCAFTPLRGFTGDGTAAYLETPELISAPSNFTLNNAHLFVYCNLQGAATSQLPHVGAKNSTLVNISPSTTGALRTGINDATVDAATGGVTRLGNRLVARISSDSRRVYENGNNLTGDQPAPSTSLTNNPFTLLRRTTSYCPDRIGAFGYGGRLSTSAIVRAYMDLVQEVMVALGANY